ncbi:hypothetical protein KUL156_44030 [Alteromonas sp. KUL156]|nr:hypothetical protein KUL106_08220 [Alteromonas sp. KUL106]GFD77885.1 hypothetical protein KUL118_07470 [Tenacibaculum sp. KUL118]GFD92421.1 hypothetical protein KUL154_11540 [Alteromonas sp. KUL154]GFE01811.1 hypothetical protein KUL156_44030 [Alteromonas sp. KUL156]
MVTTVNITADFIGESVTIIVSRLDETGAKSPTNSESKNNAMEPQIATRSTCNLENIVFFGPLNHDMIVQNSGSKMSKNELV